MEYIVLLVPAVLALTGLTVIYQLARALTRATIEDPDLGERRVWRTQQVGVRIRRAGIYALGGLLVASAIIVTPPGHRGVVFSHSGGVQQTERVEGLSFIVPLFQSVVQMDVRTQLHEYELPLQTLDLQEVKVPVGVNAHVAPTDAAALYQEVGRDYAAVLIKPAVEQIVKAEVGLIRAVDFAQQRDQLASDVLNRLAAELAPRGVVVEFVAIEDAVFDPDFIRAVKEKIIADEEASEQARLVEAAKSQALQVEATATGTANKIRIEAEAQAEANRTIAESLTEDLLIWQRVNAWNGTLPATYLSPGGGDPLEVLLDVR